MKTKIKKTIGIWSVAALLISAIFVVGGSHNQEKAPDKGLTAHVDIKGVRHSSQQDAKYKHSPLYMVNTGGILEKKNIDKTPHAVNGKTALDLLFQHKSLAISHKPLSSKSMQATYQHSPLYIIGFGGILEKKNIDNASHAQTVKQSKGEVSTSQGDMAETKSIFKEKSHAFNGKTVLEIMWGV